MKNWAGLGLLLLAGCSTAPIADLMDYLAPGEIGQEKTAPYGGVCNPRLAGPPIGAVPLPPGGIPAGGPPPVGALAPIATPPPPATTQPPPTAPGFSNVSPTNPPLGPPSTPPGVSVQPPVPIAPTGNPGTGFNPGN
jgi:hypothetical protein